MAQPILQQAQQTPAQPAGLSTLATSGRGARAIAFSLLVDRALAG